MLVSSSEKRQREKLSYERKANLRAQIQLPTSMRTNFPEKSLTHIYISRESIDTYVYTFTRNDHQGTDIQVYIERQSNEQNVIVGNSKTTAAFLYFLRY